MFVLPVGLAFLGALIDPADPVPTSTTGTPPPAPASQPSNDIRDSAVARCRSRMEAIGGASTVRVCVDTDRAAYDALQRYDAERSSLIARCQRQMPAMGGWEIVRVCADEDIASEQSLR